jgi:geranylgeranyl pyrophosphate synthase
MKQPKSKPHAAMEEIQRIFTKRGASALEQARKRVLEEKLQSRHAQEALEYFMNEYWHDTARPSLMALACEAVSGRSEPTTSIAVPMILISGAIDIHDDIIDQSRSKDGRLTVYGRFGKEIALLVGDALLFKGLTMLCETCTKNIPTEKIARAVDIIRSMFFELGDAEALELELRGRLDVSPADYLRIVGMKAADVEAHTRISAILGDATEKEIEALSEYGRLLGTMIILRDDLVDLMIPEECRSRIRKEVLPLPLLYGLQDQKHKHQLRSILQSRTISRKQTQLILREIYASKAISQYNKLMKNIAEKARSKLELLSHDTKELHLIVEAMLPNELKGTRAEN